MQSSSLRKGPKIVESIINSRSTVINGLPVGNQKSTRLRSLVACGKTKIGAVSPRNIFPKL